MSARVQRTTRCVMKQLLCTGRIFNPSFHSILLTISLHVYFLYLGHEPVGLGMFLVFEVNVSVVVAHQFIEALRVARYPALRFSARSQVVLRNSGHVLLVRHWSQFALPRATAVTRARPASVNH